MLRNLTKTILKKGHTHTNPRPSQYLTHVHSHITGAVACSGSHGQLFRPHFILVPKARRFLVTWSGNDAHQHGDMAVRMREVLARPWVGVCVPCFKFVLEILLLLYIYDFIF